MAMRRLRKELEEVTQYGVTDVKSIGPVNDNLLEWRAKFYGPEDSPYEGGLFSVDIVFPTNYPFEAPRVKFRTCIYHPSICRSSGQLCNEILSDGWAPNKNIKHIVRTLQEVMAYPTSTSPLDADVARQYERHRREFNRTAREWTKLYAK